jgi:hypothetical protein
MNNIFYTIKPNDGTNSVTIKKILLNGEVADKLLESDNDFYEIDGCNIFAEIHKCTISREFFIDNTEYPILYLSVMYNKKVLVGSLLQYFLIFEPDHKPGSNIDKSVESGRFYYVLKGDDNLLLNTSFRTKKYIDNFVSVKDVIHKFMDLKTNEEFLNIIKNGIKVRDEERQKQGHVFSYDINKKIINLKEVQERGYI